MCGRFVQVTSAADLEFSFHTRNPLPNTRPRFNASPGQELLVVRRNPETGERSLDQLVWGLVPHWSKDRKIGWRCINARAETVDTLPAFRSAFRKRRCLVPAEAFYEWRKEGSRKQPYALAMKSRELFGLAGLWENWKDPETGEWLRTFTIITTEPNELAAQFHDRMPAIIGPDDYERWLTPDTEVKDLLRPYPAELMTAWPVSLRVNSPVVDEPDLLEAAE